jgi:cytochrome c biogenesis protein CcmG/thiol:disulfide interchange protein DsbE
MQANVPTVLKLVGSVTLVVLVVMGVEQARQFVRTSTVVSAAADPGGQGVVRLVRNAKPVPQFAVTAFDGRKFSPGALRGKVAIINFWATWCGPCRAEIPAFIALQNKYPDQLVILGLSEDETGEAGVRQFVAATHMSYPVGMATDAIEKAFGGVTNLPTSFVVDREGKVVQRHVGLYGPEVYEGEVRALLGLSVNGVVERFDDDGRVSLENAAEATKIPGVDLSALSPERRKTALQRLNAEHCTCGCGLTLAQCRINDPTCETSLPLAKAIVATIAKGGGK